LGKNVRKLQGGIFLTHTVVYTEQWTVYAYSTWCYQVHITRPHWLLVTCLSALSEVLSCLAMYIYCKWYCDGLAEWDAVLD